MLTHEYTHASPSAKRSAPAPASTNCLLFALRSQTCWSTCPSESSSVSAQHRTPARVPSSPTHSDRSPCTAMCPSVQGVDDQTHLPSRLQPVDCAAPLASSTWVHSRPWLSWHVSAASDCMAFGKQTGFADPGPASRDCAQTPVVWAYGVACFQPRAPQGTRFTGLPSVQNAHPAVAAHLRAHCSHDHALLLGA